MRIYEDRYTRERLRFQVALRFIRLEARTQTIRHWTGLTDDRIRKLYRSYLLEAPGPALPRHRGKSPQRIGAFLRSVAIRQESALLASLYRLVGALPERTDGVPAPSLRRAELLCQAYESYRSLVGQPLLGFEHGVFLLTALLSAAELVCDRCANCQALLVRDRWSLRAPRCELCAAEACEQRSAAAASAAAPGAAAHLPLPPRLCKTDRDGDFHTRHSP